MAILENVLALLIFAAAAEAPLFELHAASSASSPGAKAWTMKARGGATEILYLDETVLLDASAVATADVERGPDGSPQIRLGLTPGGAQRLAEAAARFKGKRLGVVAAGRLRAAPYLTGVPAGGVFVIAGGFSDVEADGIAGSLGPPSRANAGAMAAAPRTGGSAIPELQGRWRIVEASMNGSPMLQPKIVATAWHFHGGDLTLTNGEGLSVTFAVRAERPGLLRLDPSGGSSEKGGWLLWSREKQDLIVAFHDNLEGRPDGFQPAPKTIVARLRPVSAR